MKELELNGEIVTACLAGRIDSEGLIPVAVTIRLWPIELILLAEKAQAEKVTIDAVLARYVESSPDGIGGGLLEYLQMPSPGRARFNTPVRRKEAL